MAAVLGIMGLLFIRIAQTQIQLSWRAFWSDIQPGLVCSLLMMAGVLIFRSGSAAYLKDNLFTLALEVLIGALLYPLLLKLFYPRCWQQALGILKRKRSGYVAQ
jgi:hypothetical protein